MVTILTLWILTWYTNSTNVNRASSNSNPSTIAPEVETDTEVVMLFPNNPSESENLTMCEILRATENFSEANIIDCGSYSLVYKATLANGSKLAIKKLLGDFDTTKSNLKAAVEAVSKYQHENLVSLQGYCVYNGSWLLIHPFMENGSLDFWLHEKAGGASQLDWPTRLKIAKGASCGLAYIQQTSTKPQPVLLNFKSSKILLNENFEPRLSDLGLSQLVLANESAEFATEHFSSTNSDVPANDMHGLVSTLREDVYSFGVVILELLTGKRPVEVYEPKMSRELVNWVRQMKSQEKEDQVFDPLLRGKGFEDQMLQVLDLACMCVHQNVLVRPTIGEIVDKLKNVGTMSQ
ncbi:hypothetical protein TIFTF001_048801 [Ficus carica]|uniref:non-specific serine/threonine protein kinase n=1 Tax=Ficus carica TaxID=3494 RepID=A0AA87YXK0_FICCA|nr:hypothetical protein TIFTF001_048799 [Ficus carica]GMN20790.1 hypothetical protein TIFTF001_048801 [Ficus carica]